jgi:hypothetical protein
MNNAVRRGPGEGNVPPINRNYIEISDDEDSDEDVVAMMGPAAGRRQRPLVQGNNNQAVLSSSPPPAANGNEAPQPGDNVAPSPPRQEYPGVHADADFAAFAIEDGDEFDVNDPYLAQIMEEGFSRERDEQAAHPREPANRPLLNQPNELSPPSAVDTKAQCIDQVLAVFPGICGDYISELYNTNDAKSSDYLIAHILDKIDKGTPYPKAKDTQKTLKRKREVDEDEEAARKYGSAYRVIPDGPASVRPFM